MATREADRRQVTVLFADVSGFTALAERLDPEELRAFQNALFDMLAQAVARYDGFVEKFVGDAVMAVFGAPVAHEDDPERALHAALDMLGRSAAFMERWAERLGQPLDLHIGINTGPVVAGSLGNAGGAAYAVTGDTVNTTARLLAAASGNILVSDATHALTRHRFAFEPARHLTLRGKSELIVTHRLLGVLPVPQSARGLAAHGLTAPMVGRADELDQLLAAFDRMQRGRAQVVNVAGEAGAGKSRLVTEFLARLEAQGRLARTAVRRTTCSALGEPTYGIFGTLFREAYQVERSDSLEVARQKLAAGLCALGAPAEVAEATAPVLSYLLGVEAKPRDLEPEQLRRQIGVAARTLVSQRLRQGPLLIVVEDLHCADAASVDLLRDVVDHLSDRALMMLFSHRSEARPPLMARAAQVIVRLAPLSPSETQTLVGSLFGPVDESAFAKVLNVIAMRAGGNPLFVEEIVRSLVSNGVLVHRDDCWVCTAGCDAVNIPPTLHGLLLSRVDRLPIDARRLLQGAAVLGEVFDEAMLQAITTDTEAAETALDALVELNLIQRDGDGPRYRFTHPLIHEVVYQNLLLSRRSELHEQAARAIERATTPRPERLSDLEALGHHWSLSPDKARGARYLEAAGDWARSVYANDDAIRHYGRALRTLADCQACQDQARAVREKLADVQALIGQRAKALGHYETVRQELEAAADPVGAARLHRKIGALHWEAGDRERAGASFALGLERLGEEGSPVERAQLFQELGRLAFRAGDNAGAIAWAERALLEAAWDEANPDAEHAREAAATRAQAYNTVGVSLARTGRLGDAADKIEQSIGMAERHNLLQVACRGYANLGVLYSSLDPRRSIQTCLRGLETAKRVGDLGFQSRLYANLAVAYCALTDRCEKEGLEAVQMSIELDRRLELLDHLAVPLIVLGQIKQCQGQYAEALASFQEALDLAEENGEPQLLFPCYDGLATLYLDAGNEVLAEVYLAKSKEVCERAGLKPDGLMVLPFFC